MVTGMQQIPLLYQLDLRALLWALDTFRKEGLLEDHDEQRIVQRLLLCSCPCRSCEERRETFHVEQVEPESLEDPDDGPGCEPN